MCVVVIINKQLVIGVIVSEIVQLNIKKPEVIPKSMRFTRFIHNKNNVIRNSVVKPLIHMCKQDSDKDEISSAYAPE